MLAHYGGPFVTLELPTGGAGPPFGTALFGNPNGFFPSSAEQVTYYIDCGWLSQLGSALQPKVGGVKAQAEGWWFELRSDRE